MAKTNFKSSNQINQEEAAIMLSILRKHDAGTLAPEIPFQDREPVSCMFDKLRFHLGTIVDKEVIPCR